MAPLLWAAVTVVAPLALQPHKLVVGKIWSAEQHFRGIARDFGGLEASAAATFTSNRVRISLIDPVLRDAGAARGRARPDGGVPLHLDLQQIGKAMAGTDDVASVHDLHVWSLSSSRIALSAHVVLDDLTTWPGPTAGWYACCTTILTSTTKPCSRKPAPDGSTPAL